MADITSIMNILNIPDITDMTGMMFVNRDILYAIIPILIIGAYYLKKSTKKLLVLSRMVVAVLIIIALASPYTLTAHRITDTEPTITIIDDRSQAWRSLMRRSQTRYTAPYMIATRQRRSGPFQAIKLP
ncbi:MAG TPA: hypothetical protein EYP67_03070 [Methanosarcinales archaeon]|nr:hypothetical protein [Methanosarcinales archaeon]